MVLDEARTTGDTAADHVTDHNALHAWYNNQQGASIRLTATDTTSVASDSTWLDIDWDGVDFDDANFWEGVTNPERITFPEAGRFEITANVHTTESNELFIMQVALNGSSSTPISTLNTPAQAFGSRGSLTCQHVSTGSDYVTVQVYSPAGTGKTLAGHATTGETCRVFVKRIGNT